MPCKPRHSPAHLHQRERERREPLVAGRVQAGPQRDQPSERVTLPRVRGQVQRCGRGKAMEAAGCGCTGTGGGACSRFGGSTRTQSASHAHALHHRRPNAGAAAARALSCIPAAALSAGPPPYPCIRPAGRAARCRPPAAPAPPAPAPAGTDIVAHAPMCWVQSVHARASGHRREHTGEHAAPCQRAPPLQGRPAAGAQGTTPCSPPSSPCHAWRHSAAACGRGSPEHPDHDSGPPAAGRRKESKQGRDGWRRGPSLGVHQSCFIRSEARWGRGPCPCSRLPPGDAACHAGWQPAVPHARHAEPPVCKCRSVARPLPTPSPPLTRRWMVVTWPPFAAECSGVNW